MTTLRPNIETPHSGPDLEDLAAYIDGRLDAERRRAVEERLVRDEDYYEVFLETTRLLAEEDLTATTATKRPMWLPLLAAAALLAIAVGVWRVADPVDPAEPIAWLDGLDAATIVQKPNWDEPHWSVTRDTTGIPSYLNREQLAFRLGVHTVDLRLALAAEDLPQAKTASSRVASLAEEMELFVGPYFAELIDPYTATPASDLATEARVLENSLIESLGPETAESRSFARGQWLQTTCAAALAADQRIFSALIARAPRADDHPELREDLAALEEIAENTAAPGAWSRAIEKLAAITKALGG